MKVSRALVATSIFLAINVAIPASANLKGATVASVTGDTIQLALRQAQQQLVKDSIRQSPVVFIGSSLIIAPLWSTDVKHGYFFKDCMLHHQSQCFEDILRKEGISAPVVSLATAGQFVSDTYLIIDKLIAGKQPGSQGSGQQESQGSGQQESQGSGQQASHVGGQQESQGSGQQASQVGGQQGSQVSNQQESQGSGQQAGQVGGQQASQVSSQGSSQPLALIYGVAPRDFMDDTTGGLAMTSVFDELVDASDLPKIDHLFFSTFNEKADFLLNRSVYLYRKRGRYQNKIKDGFEKTVAHAMHDRALLAKNNAAGSAANDPLAGFLLGNNRNDVWSKSIDEYRKRYKFFNQQQFEKQKECFKAVVALCQSRGIKLYVVAMPITDDNLKLMPEELYRSYINCLATTTKEAGVPFLDLQKSRQYKNDDFYDTVHLNGSGGERFLAAMSNFVFEKPGSGAAAIAGTKRSSNPTY